MENFGADSLEGLVGSPNMKKTLTLFVWDVIVSSKKKKKNLMLATELVKTGIWYHSLPKK